MFIAIVHFDFWVDTDNDHEGMNAAAVERQLCNVAEYLIDILVDCFDNNFFHFLGLQYS